MIRMNFKLLIIIFFTLSTTKVLFAFDGILQLKKKAFIYQKYNFYIEDVIDARPNKAKAVGYLKKLSGHKLTVGNEKLGEELRSYFLKDTLPFNKVTKIILVINQVNFSNEESYIRYNLGFDYYKIVGNKATLIYSQFEQQFASLGLNTINDINKGFSTAVEKAFLNFKKQLWYYHPLLTESIDISELKKTKDIIPLQINNLKEGLYFNINQIYGNCPALVSGYNMFIDTGLTTYKVSIKSSNYLINKTYAFVKDKRLYFYWKNNYYPAKLENDSNLYLKNVRIPKVVSDPYLPSINSCKPNAILFEMGFILLLAVIQEQSTNNNYFLKDVKIDLETGQLN